MKTILVCNQKGGVGKSLVADEIAFSFERSGIPVSFYDLDAQGGTLHKTNEADGAQVAVVDTPGGAPGGAVGLVEGGGRGGHPHPYHVEGHRAFDAHAQGGVQARAGENRLRDERMEPLQGVPRLHGMVRRACGRPDGGPRCPSPRRSCRPERLACPWSSTTAGARPRGRRWSWWTRCAGLRGSRRNNRRSEPCSVWTD